MSSGTQQSLQAASYSLFSWFNSAGEAFTPPPTSASGSGGTSFSGAFTGAKIGLMVFKGLSGGGGGGFS
jgi:hypothetical protein